MKILVLAGGFDQIALINELKERNHEVILADYYENPPAKKYADKHYQISTLDEKLILELAKNENVDLITTACTDQALLTVSKVAEELNLPCYLSYQTALNVTNKLYMKDVFSKNNIPTSKYKIIKEINEIQELNLKYPLVVKPCDCNSSKGVVKVFNYNDLELAVKEALKLSRTNNAVVEEYKEGIEVSVDVFVKDGVAKLLSMTQTKKIKNNNSFTICQSCYPVEKVKENQENEIQNIAQNIANAFNLKNSPILIQAIINKDEITVLEFSARMGGGTKYKLIETISGVNIMKQYVNLILGQETKVNPEEKVKYVNLSYCYCNNGVLKELKGFDELKNDNFIFDYFQYKTSGMEIDQALNSGDRAAGYLVIASSESELKEKENYIKNNIKIFDKNGKDIYIRNCEVN